MTPCKKDEPSPIEDNEFISTLRLTFTEVMTIIRTDKDSRNFEIGLKATAKTVATANGSLKVTLRHQPEVGGKPVKN